MEDILPFYMAIGVSYERFMDSCPVELQPFIEAWKMKRNMLDENMWIMQRYMCEAVTVAVANCFSKKSKAKLPETPYMKNAEIKNRNTKLSKKEKKSAQEELMNRLKLMQANFEMNKK